MLHTMVSAFLYDSAADLPDYVPEELNVLIRLPDETDAQVLERSKSFFHASVTPVFLTWTYTSGGALCGPPDDWYEEQKKDPLHWMMEGFISWRTPLMRRYLIGDVGRCDEFLVHREPRYWLSLREVKPEPIVGREIVVQPMYKHALNLPILASLSNFTVTKEELDALPKVWTPPWD